MRVHATLGADRSVASNEIRRARQRADHATSPRTWSAETVNGNGVVLAWRNTFEGGQPTGLVLDVSGSATGQIPLGVTETFTVGGAASPPGASTRCDSGARVNRRRRRPPSDPLIVTVPAACPGAPGGAIERAPGYRVGNVASHRVGSAAGWSGPVELRGHRDRIPSSVASRPSGDR